MNREGTFIILMRVSECKSSLTGLYVPNTLSGPFAGLDEALWFTEKNPTPWEDCWYYNSMVQYNENGKLKLFSSSTEYSIFPKKYN